MFVTNCFTILPEYNVKILKLNLILIYLLNIINFVIPSLTFYMLTLMRLFHNQAMFCNIV